jgi:hypothetical protein
MFGAQENKIFLSEQEDKMGLGEKIGHKEVPKKLSFS